MNNLDKSIFDLIKYWNTCGIKTKGCTFEDSNKEQLIPTDFKDFYGMVNGMIDYYPNEMDEQGFLFYPIEGIVSTNEEFGNNNRLQNDGDIYIFAEYMHKSWWYGVEVNKTNHDKYQILIVLSNMETRVITNSLSEFIQLYLVDSDKLYDVD